jgi:hypothetical protein
LLASLDENYSKIANDETGVVQESSTDRYHPLTEDEVESFYAKASSRNTSRMTKTWLNTYLSWAETRNQRQDIENISPVDLNAVLGQFYAELKKKNGEDYEPESLAVMQASLDRHLKEKGFTLYIDSSRPPVLFVEQNT